MKRFFYFITKDWLIVFVLLLICFVLMLARLTKPVTSLRAFGSYVLSLSYEMPLELSKNSTSLAHRLKDFILLHQQNKILREKILRVDLLQNQLHNAEKENKELRRLLEIKAKEPIKTIAANVFSYDPQLSMQVIWLDAGQDQGIVKDAAVLALKAEQQELFVVGRVVQTEKNSSRVLLISDPLSSVSVQLEKSGNVALLQGQGNFNLTLDFLNLEAPLEKGELIVTSGFGGVFPKGLKVGVVEKRLASRGGFARVKVKPLVSLSALKQVLILQK